MSNSSKKLNNKFSYVIFAVVFFLQFINCAPYFKKEPINFPNIIQNEKNLKTISSLKIKGNIIIDSPDNTGKLYANFNFEQPDSLIIQFRDPVGRKQALMSFLDESFELWLQRENKYFNRKEIPNNFALFVFEELSLKEIRKIFLGRPLFDFLNIKNNIISNSISSLSENKKNIITYFNKNNTIRRVEIYSDNDELSSIFIYSEWQKNEDVYFPENIHIVDLDSSIELKIKLFHFSIEYFNFDI